MGNLFCANEVIEMGIQIKKNGKSFYSNVAKSTKAKRVKNIFQWLALEQDRHIKVFDDMLVHIDKCARFEQYPGEYSSYIEALISDYALGPKVKGRVMPRKVKDNAQAIDLAIDFEKDSILFYDAMQPLVRAKERKAIGKLIEQEHEHIRRLSQLKKCLTRSDLKACLIR